MSPLPLVPGQRGEAIRDLQRRLSTAGYSVAAVQPGTYCDNTSESVEKFQRDRGLRPSGICDVDTWTALVEAGHRLGSRLLLLSAPQLRGDDVVELQSSLAQIGFDPGRVDGVLGADTARALRDFQYNSGLTVDGICGPRTITALEVLARQTGDGPGVAAIRELEQIRSSARSFTDLRIVVGQFGAMSTVARQLVQALRHRSATVVASDEPDPAAQAAMANRFQATIYIGFDVGDEQTARIEYFSAPRFESAGGRTLATLIANEFASLDDVDRFSVEGMQLPILRATRMPAVLISVGQVKALVDRSAEYVSAVVNALNAWVGDPELSTNPHE